MAGKVGRLTRRDEFQRLYRQGASWANQLLVLKALPNSLAINRYGFSVGKAVGKACRRNRVKRQLRESIRRLRLKQGWDVLLVARAPVAGRRFREVAGAVEQLAGRARLKDEQ